VIAVLIDDGKILQAGILEQAPHSVAGRRQLAAVFGRNMELRAQVTRETGRKSPAKRLSVHAQADRGWIAQLNAIRADGIAKQCLSLLRIDCVREVDRNNDARLALEDIVASLEAGQTHRVCHVRSYCLGTL
jgi:hypothetical protein